MFTGKGFLTSPEDDDGSLIHKAITYPTIFLSEYYLDTIKDGPKIAKEIIKAGEFSKLRGRRRAYEERRDKIGKEMFNYEGNLH